MVKKEKLSLDELLEHTLVKDEDKPYDVPGNWVWTRLEFIGDVRGGKRLPQGCTLLDEITPYPYLRVVDFGDRTINTDNIKFLDESTYRRISNYTISNQDVYISIAGTIGKVGIIHDDLSGANLTENAAKIINLKHILKEYLCLVLCSSELQTQIIDSSTTTTQSKLALFRIGRLRIPLPPLPEQQRIVDLVESLFEKLDRANELVQSALDSFENRKSAILNKAFIGDLTANWREKNSVMDVEVVLEDLCKYRLDLVKTHTERTKIESIFKNKERNSNIKLPKGWRFVTLEKLCESFQYGTSTKSDNSGEVVVIRMGNLQSGKIDWTNLKYTSDINDIEKYILKKGNVLFNRTNSPELVGKTSIYLGEKPAIFAGYLIRINNFEQLDSTYLNYVMNSSFAKEYCMSVKSDGINQSNINAQKLARFEIPFCSFTEQREIVHILDNILENEQKAKERYDVIDNIDSMKKSILARAFRGELSTNNPNEESALGLLREVLSEK